MSNFHLTVISHLISLMAFSGVHAQIQLIADDFIHIQLVYTSITHIYVPVVQFQGNLQKHKN